MPGILHGKRLRLRQGIAVMVIPAGQENVGHLELKKEAVEARLGEPIDEIQYIFHGVRALDAHAPVSEGGFLFVPGRKRLPGDPGHHLGLLIGA